MGRESLSDPLHLGIKEDMRLLGNEFWKKSGKPLTMSERRQLLAQNLDKYTFDTERTWTFQLWQHFVDFATYEL